MFRTANRSAILRRIAASTALTGALLLPQLAQAQALPTGGAPASPADVTIATGAVQVTVTQTSARSVINWQSFDVAQGNSVVFNQPSATAATLNRVTGGTASTIAGQITSTGAVYLVNPNGIAITSTGDVQTGGGFVASTLNITDENFIGSANTFTGTGASAAVSSAGSITGNGFVALLGGTVSHSGAITVPAGRVALASGEAITLDLNGGDFLTVALPTNATAADGKALIAVGGSITVQSAPGSDSVITIAAATAANAVRNAINVSGALSASRASGQGGVITLSGGVGGAVTVSGSVTSRARSIGGGAVIEGDQVNLNDAIFDLASTAVGGTGGFLEVTASAIMANGSLSRALDTTRFANFYAVRIGMGDGAIRFTAPVASSGTGTLLLQARTDISLASVMARNVQLTMNAGDTVAYVGAVGSSGAIDVGLFNLTNGNWSQNTGTLPAFAATDFRFDRTRATFLRTAGGDGSAATPYRIIDVYGLQGMASSNQLASNFALANDIDATGTFNWNGGAGFVGIGTDNAPFTGSLSGANPEVDRLAIRGLTQNRADYGGLFGVLNGTLSDLDLTAVSITAPGNRAGAAAGIVNTTGRITNVSSSGRMSGGNNVGGLVGSLRGGSVTDAASSVVVIGSGGSIGGLVGNMVSGSVLRGAASGTVNGVDRVGGLVGDVTNGATVTDSSASGVVTGTGTDVTLAGTGGLVGRLLNEIGTTSSISNSVATGTVNGATNVGGLVGYQNATAGGKVTIAASSATGTVMASGTNVGGLVGRINVTGTTAGTIASVASSYATGPVSMTSNSTASYVGGLVGQAIRGSDPALALTVSNAYATGAVRSGGNGVGGLVGFASYGTLENVYATGSVTGSSSVGGLVGNASTGTSINSAYASGAVSGSNVNIGGLIGIRNATSTTLSNAYWDRYSTGRTNGVGTGTAGGVSVSSDPNRGQADPSAYAEASYANLIKGASSVGTANTTGFVFMPGNSTRPFLAFEVPTAARTGVVSTDLASVRSIVNSHQLQLIGYNAETLSGNYRLAGNIDLAETGRATGTTAGNYSGMWAPTGFVSLGTDGAGLTWDGTSYKLVGQITSGTYGFSGTVDGVKRTLSNLTINRPTANNTGLVGVLSGTIRNLSVGGSVTGAQITGGLVGLMVGGATGSAFGTTPTLSNVNSAVAVTGTQLVGGLVGSATRRSTVSGSASGTVRGTNTVGGLIGAANRATVNGSASGAVTGQSYVGGLIGQQFAGTSIGSATGTVTGTNAVGGLIGVLDGTSTERGDATALSASQTVNGPSSADRNFGRITANGTGRTGIPGAGGAQGPVGTPPPSN